MLKEAFDQNQRELREQFPLVAKACESVLLIVPYKKGEPLGQSTSVVVEGNHIITAGHVIEEAETIRLYTVANGLNLVTDYIGKITPDPHLDVAVFRLPEEFEPVVPACKLSQTNPLASGQAFIIGFPQIDRGLQWPLYGRQPTIHSTRIFYHFSNYLATLSFGSEVIEMSDGMSGGAIVDTEGKVVGVFLGNLYPNKMPVSSSACFYYGTNIDSVRSML